MASGRSGGHSSGQVLSSWILRLEDAGPLTGGPSLRPCCCSVHGEVLHTVLQSPAGVFLCPFLQRRSCCSSVCGSRRSQACGSRCLQACSWCWALSRRSSAALAHCFQSRALHSWQLVLDVGSGRWWRTGQEGEFQREWVLVWPLLGCSPLHLPGTQGLQEVWEGTAEASNLYLLIPYPWFVPPLFPLHFGNHKFIFYVCEFVSVLCVCSVSQLCPTLCNSLDCTLQAPLSMGFFR